MRKRPPNIGFYLWLLVIVPGVCQAGEMPHLNEVESRLWRLAEKEQASFEPTTEIFNCPVLLTYLDRIARRLWGHVESPLPPIEIRILMDPTLKAFAYPNGIVYLSTGVLSHCRNEDQLAAIIAHEIVHYSERHALSAFSQNQGPSIFPAADATGQAVSQGLQGLCDAAELQADASGLAMARTAGYNPREMLMVLLNLKAFEEHQHPDSPDLSSTDASWHLRIERIKGVLWP